LTVTFAFSPPLLLLARRTNRAGLNDVRCSGQTGNDLQRGKTALLTHLRYRLNDERTDNGHNFLKPRGRSVKPVEEKRRSGIVFGGLRRRINALSR
jgi:hypothetical protein